MAFQRWQLIAILVGLAVIGIVALVAWGVRALGGSSTADLGANDRRAVRDALRRATPPADPELRSAADHEARRQAKVLPLWLWIYPVLILAQVGWLVTADAWWMRAVAAYNVVFFTWVVLFFGTVWRRAKRYLAVSD